MVERNKISKFRDGDLILPEDKLFRGTIGYRIASQKPLDTPRLSARLQALDTSISLTDKDWEVLESVLEDESDPSESLLADVLWFKKNFS